MAYTRDPKAPGAASGKQLYRAATGKLGSSAEQAKAIGAASKKPFVRATLDSDVMRRSMTNKDLSTARYGSKKEGPQAARAAAIKKKMV